MLIDSSVPGTLGRLTGRRGSGKMVGDRAQHDGRHERKCTDQEHGPQQHRGEREIVGQERSRRLGSAFLLGEKAGDRDRQHERREPAQQEDDAGGDVPRGVVVGQSLEPRAVIGRGRGELVEHLAETVRAGVGRGRLAPAGRREKGRAARDQERVDQDDDHRQLDLPGLDLLAEVFGRSAHHQPGEKHGHDDIHQHVQEAGADAAEIDVEHHERHRHQAAQRLEAIVHRIDRAVGGGRRDRRPGRRGDRPQPHFLALEVAPLLRRANRPRPRSAGSRHRSPRATPTRSTASITPKITVACARSLIIRPNMTIDGHRDDDDRDHLEQVAPGARVLERMRRVRPEEAAAVGAELLDRDLGGHRADGDRLGRPARGARLGGASKRHRHAGRHQQRPPR